MMFTPASKKETKLRLAITGLSGGGKTFTALELATGFGGKIALVDTEHRSASKYADRFKFDVLDMDPPYHPQKYIDAIEAAQSMGYTTIILDSLSHVWTGTGGIVSIVDDIASHSKTGSDFFAWNEGTEWYKKLIEAILQSNIHVIGTIRMKQDYSLDKDEKGKTRVTRVGIKPIQRKDFEFEFDVVMDMDAQNKATITKTRCNDLPMGTVIPKPGVGTARTLMTWLHGTEWVQALSEKAVAFAAEAWKMPKSEAWGKLDRAIKEEELSGFLPKDEFKQYVEK